MTSPNHIVGGIAITGISLSFYNINIFESPINLGLTIFASLLPDIDHTKSIIGKLFYPIAKFLDKNYGHRTITHSLAFLVPTTLFVAFIEQNIINPSLDLTGFNYTLITLFGIISHLILDMVTVSGIPLFYPFLRNPCVIPANPSYRIRSGNLKSESIAMALFCVIVLSSYDLFENGFWTSYNRSFGTIKHVFREFKSSENIVATTYEFTFNGEKKVGSGYVLEATETSLDLWIDDNIEPRILKIDLEDNRFKNVEVLPTQTSYKYSIKDFNFDFINIEELNDSLDNKIVSGIINSSNTFRLNNKIYKKGKLVLDKEISPRLKWIDNDTLNDIISNKIELQKAKLYDIQMSNYEEREKLRNLKNALFQYELNLKNSKDIYSKNKYERLIIEQNKKIENFNLNLKSTNLIVQEIKQLKEELNKKRNDYFSGRLKIYFVPKNDEDFKVANN